jgi:hypothetical protein
MSEVEVPRDRYGRPMVVPPKGGKPVAYTRTTTVAGSLDDGTALVAWKLRMAAAGLTLRPDLLLAASANRDNKLEMDKLVDDAMTAAGATAQANIGTAIHTLTEKYDRGEDLGVIPEEYVADIQAYADATKKFKNVFIEQFCVLDKYKIAGTPDRVVEYNGELYISDLKTGSISYPNKIAMQLAVYAHGLPYDPATATRGSWGGVNQEKGIIVHLPAGSGKCELHFVDIAQGWKGIELAMKVRTFRDTKKSLVTSIQGE